MCKKLTKLVKDSEAMKEELAKYRSLYGDVNASLTVEEVSSSFFMARVLVTFPGCLTSSHVCSFCGLKL